MIKYYDIYIFITKYHYNRLMILYKIVNIMIYSIIYIIINYDYNNVYNHYYNLNI